MIKLKKDNEMQVYVAPKFDIVVFPVDDVFTASGEIDPQGAKWNDSWSGSIKNLWDED